MEWSMKRVILGLAAAAAVLSTHARAADLPIPVEPIVAPVSAFTWTGFYAGANIGWGCCADQEVGLFLDDPDVRIGNVGSLDDDGIFGGVQVGYNYQWNWLVVGAEADWQLSAIYDDDSGSAGGLTTLSSSDVDWFGTLRGRAGFAWERLLLYGTGGLAAGNTEYTVKITNGPGAIREDEKVNWGWAAGLGTEFAFTDNLSAKAEWQYIDLGPTEEASGGGFSTHPTIEFHTFRVGVNYRFNGLFQ